MNTVQSDIVLMGHTHKPFHKTIFSEKENRYKNVINVGSVGKPKQGDNKACYTILDLGSRTEFSQPSSLKVDFRFIAYDARKVIHHIQKIGLSDAYNDFLLHGEK
jgi:diadenosine tetraphosphatase ApaH/serine/threonine PP2A family protein phosphatase